MIWGWNELIILNYSYLIQYNPKQERTITPFAGILQINGSLADINVENRAKRKYPREKFPQPTKVRKLFFNAY